MDLIDAMKKGKVSGIEPVSRIIDTQISNVFLGKTRAYKIYKKSVAFFGNLSNNSYRRQFYKDDFSWNHLMSPDVYLKLRPVRFKNGKFVDCRDRDAQDYIIEMKRIDSTRTFSDILFSKAATKEDIKRLVSTLSKQVNELTRHKKKDATKTSDSWHYLYSLRLKDIAGFASGQSTIPKDNISKALKQLSIHHRQSDYLKNFSKKNIAAGIDMHSDNVLVDKKIMFIDIFLVEERWRALDPYYNICRLAADITSLGQPELLDELYSDAEKILGRIPKDVKISYELSSSLIKGAYNAIIGKHDLAILYIPLIKKHTLFLGKYSKGPEKP